MVPLTPRRGHEREIGCAMMSNINGILLQTWSCTFASANDLPFHPPVPLFGFFSSPHLPTWCPLIRPPPAPISLLLPATTWWQIRDVCCVLSRMHLTEYDDVPSFHYSPQPFVITFAHCVWVCLVQVVNSQLEAPSWFCQHSAKMFTELSSSLQSDRHRQRRRLKRGEETTTKNVKTQTNSRSRNANTWMWWAAEIAEHEGESSSHSHTHTQPLTQWDF